jgi:inner membrane protein oxaA
MQEMQPKIKELQEKYKSNPQRMNTEMARLYQEAGYSPLSGCLPMLIQIPFLFAMFALFNNYFEFRGASFIPGWIGDLSSGDSVWRFGFTIPFLGWTDLRILPIIYVASQLVFGKVTQAGPQDNSNPSMQIMVYFMPLFFFFIFYNAPSGLLLFWTASNILMLIQQIIINKALDKEEATSKKK